MVDRVQLTKYETSALGGDDADTLPYPAPIAAQEDAIEVAGVYLQDASNRDEAVLIDRNGDDMRFTDVNNAGGLTLSQLVRSVSKVGTPADNQLAVWTGDGTLEGESELTYDGTTLLVTGNVSAQKAVLTGPIRMTEVAAADADEAGKGQIWVKDNTPNDLYFTDDTGVDHLVSLTETDYAKLGGRAGGQILQGGTEASQDLTLVSTASATRGHVYLGAAQTSAFDETNERLGIGIATPDTRLHVHNATAGSVSPLANTIVTVENSATAYLSFLTPNTATSGILFGDPEDSDAGRIKYSHSTNALEFSTGGAPRVVMTSIGWIGTGGESSPLGRVHIKGSDVGVITPSTSADELVLENNGTCGMTFYSANTSTGNIYFGDVDSDTIGLISYNHSTDTLSFKDATTGTKTLAELAAAGGGNVSASGTPADNQIAVWTDSTTIEGTSSLTFSGTELQVAATAPIGYLKDAAGGAAALSRTMAGLQVSAVAMDTTGKYTPAVKFMSTDVAFTTENPKFLAGIVGRATEDYAADTDGGMALDFAVTADDPGTTNVPVVNMTLKSTGLEVMQPPDVWGGSIEVGPYDATNGYLDISLNNIVGSTATYSEIWWQFTSTRCTWAVGANGPNHNDPGSFYLFHGRDKDTTNHGVTLLYVDDDDNIEIRADPAALGASSYVAVDVDGSEVARFTSTGLGIGATPSHLLEVNGTADFDVVSTANLDSQTNTAGPNRVKMQAASSTDKFIRFRRGGSPSGNAGICYSAFDVDHWFVYGQSGGELAWAYSTENSDNPDADSASVKMLLDTTGYLGIGGSDTPDTLLHIKTGDSGATPGFNSLLTLEAASSWVALQLLTSNTGVCAIYFGDGDDEGGARYQYQHTADQHEWYITNNQKMTLQASQLIIPGLIVAQNTDITATIGRAKIGYRGVADTAAFAHYDFMTSTDAGFYQVSDGRSFMNAPTGASLNFRINNSQIGIWNASALQLDRPLWFDSSATVIDKDGGNNLSFTDAVTGTKTLAQLAGGGGAQISGTPADNQVAVWTNATTIEGDANLLWSGTAMAIGGAVIATRTLRVNDDVGSGNQLRLSRGASYMDMGPDGGTWALFSTNVSGGYFFDDRITLDTGELAGSTAAGQLTFHRNQTADPTMTITTAVTIDSSLLRINSTANPQIFLNDEGSADSSVTDGNPGLELSIGSVSALDRYTPAVKFMSTDANFTTESPKLLAWIAGRSTEPYSADTDSGMAIDFGVSHTNGGTSDTSFVGMSLKTNSATLASLGIGTQYPDSRLHVYTSNAIVSANANADELHLESSGNTGMTISSSATGLGLIAFADSGSTLAGYIEYDHSSGELTLYDQTTGSKTLAQLASTGVQASGTPVDDQLAVWTAANTIEGTSNLTFTSGQVKVINSGATEILLESTSTTTNESIIFRTNSTGFRGYWETGAYGSSHASYPGAYFVLHWENNASTTLNTHEYMIDNSGNHTIGTTTPYDSGTKLTISGQTNRVALVNNSSSTSSYAEHYYVSNQTGYKGAWKMGVHAPNRGIFWNQGGFYLYHDKSNTGTAGIGEVLEISDSGYVLIGSSPTAGEASKPLHIRRSSDSGIRLESTETSNPYCDIYTDSAGSLWLKADEGDDVASSVINFYIDNWPVARIDENGRMGLGGTTIQSDALTLYNQTDNTPGIRLYSDGSVYSRIGATAVGDLLLEADAGDAGSGSEILCYVDGSYANVKVTHDGYLALGADYESSGVSYQLTVKESGGVQYVASFWNDGNLSSRYGIRLQTGLDSPSSNGHCRWIDFFDGNGTGWSYIAYSTSSPYAAFYSYSDERLKRNVAPTEIDGLAVINGIALKQFDWRDGRAPRQTIGYIGQQVRDVYPAMVAEDEDGMLSVSDACLIPVLVKAIQELQERLNRIEAKLN